MNENSVQIAQVLARRFNRWWEGTNPNPPSFRRRDFAYIKKELESEKIIVLTGPRQIGKTTLVKQLIADLLESKTPAKRILYVQLDDVPLKDLSAKPLLDVLQAFEAHVLAEPLDLAASPTYLFLDEVQGVADWAETVKSYHDANPKLRIVCTGSASFSITQKGSENLPGRHLSFAMFPLKFIDAAIMAHPDKLDAQEIGNAAYGLRTALEESWTKGNPQAFLAKASDTMIQLQNTPLQTYFNQYLLQGGYPEIVLTKDVQKVQNLFKGYANDLILKDLMPWFNIRDFRTAEHLLFLLAQNTGHEVEYSQYIERIKASNYITLRKYVNYFEQLNIITTVPRNAARPGLSRKNDKVYFNDTGFRNALIGLERPEPTEMGAIAETVLHDHLQRLAFKLNRSTRRQITYHKTQKAEIDFILRLTAHNKSVPIECKYGKSRSKTQQEELRQFAQENGTFALSTTENELAHRNEIVHVPLWMLCLLA